MQIGDPGGGPSPLEGGSNAEEVHYLAQLAQDEFKRLKKPPGNGTICQTGFNFGNSAYAFLCATDANLFSWDLGKWDYVKPANEMIQKTFPGRHTLVTGDSTKTLPSAISNSGQNKLSCDVIFVDGGHTQEVATADIANFAQLAAPNALLIVDDCEEPAKRAVADSKKGTPWYRAAVDASFQDEESDGLINEDETKEMGMQQLTKDRSVCVGRYVLNRPQTLSSVVSSWLG